MDDIMMKFNCKFLGVQTGFGFLRTQFIVIEANTRKEAIEKFKKVKPHAILIEVN